MLRIVTECSSTGSVHGAPLIADVAPEWLLSVESPATRTLYSICWLQFLAFGRSVGITLELVDQVSELLLRAWIRSLEDGYRARGVAVVHSSIATKLVSISSFLRFCAKRGLVERNVAEAVQHKRRPSPPKNRPLSEAEVVRLLSWARRAAETAQVEFDQTQTNRRRLTYFVTRYAVLCALFGVGMRVSELCAIKVGDFKDAGPNGDSELLLVTKGGKLHRPIINRSTAAVLRAFIRKHRAGAMPTDFLFVSPFGKGIQRKSVEVMVKSAVSACLGKKLSPHGCRATLATTLVQKGVALSKIQMLLNHEDPKTTARYVRLANTRQNAAALEVDFIR